MAEPTKAAEWYRWLKLLVERGTYDEHNGELRIVMLDVKEYEALKQVVGR